MKLSILLSYISYLNCKRENDSLEIAGQLGVHVRIHADIWNMSSTMTGSRTLSASNRSTVRARGGMGSIVKSRVLAVFLVLGIVSSLLMEGVVKGVQGQGLSADFYNTTCPSVEQIVRSRMIFHFQQDPSIAAHLLRLQFHDCGFTGCDASLLVAGNQSEQGAFPNLTVLGYDVLDDIKAQLESNCTGIVSCSDMIALAARDAVALTGGPNFSVPLGRFDSLVSGGPDVVLPSPDDTVNNTLNYFHTLGLDATDVVSLLGAHTIGVAHCSSFFGRLYNFENTGAPDPSINQTFLATLQQACPQSNLNASTTVALDDTSEFVFDNHWYSMMANGHGVLTIDQEANNSNLTTSTMNQMLHNQTLFFESFAASLIKMGLIGVKDSTTGNIRTNCSIVGTSPPASPPAIGPAPPPTSGADSTVGAPQIAPASSSPILPTQPFAVSPSPVAGFSVEELSSSLLSASTAVLLLSTLIDVITMAFGNDYAV